MQRASIHLSIYRSTYLSTQLSPFSFALSFPFSFTLVSSEGSLSSSDPLRPSRGSSLIIIRILMAPANGFS